MDGALARLNAVTELPGMDQVAEYEAVHQMLQDTLATIDEGGDHVGPAAATGRDPL
ncbi:MAG TPA: hypothetical protein VFZ32_01140 [Micromonosporaceae bacterium]